jgi:hypothetical protein
MDSAAKWWPRGRRVRKWLYGSRPKSSHSSAFRHNLNRECTYAQTTPPPLPSVWVLAEVPPDSQWSAA